MVEGYGMTQSMWLKLRYDWENFKSFIVVIKEIFFWEDKYIKAAKELKKKIKSDRKYKEILKQQIKNQH